MFMSENTWSALRSGDRILPHPKARRDRRVVVSVLWLMLLTVLAAASAQAVDANLLIPGITLPDRDTPPPPLRPPSRPAGPPASLTEEDLDRPLAVSLKRILFENYEPLPPAWSGTPPDSHANSNHARPVLAEIENSVIVLQSALADPSSPLTSTARGVLEGPLTLRRIYALIEEATLAARASGWSLAHASIPVQELTGSDTLRIMIMPVWLEGVTVVGARRTRAEILTKPFDAYVGDPVHFPALARANQTITQNPFRSVSTALAPGEALGSTRVELTVKEKRPFAVFSGYETTMGAGTDPGRITTGVIMAAPWRREDIWTIQYTRHDQFGGDQRWMPFPWDSIRYLTKERERDSGPSSISTVYRAALSKGRALTFTLLWSESMSDQDAHFRTETNDLMLRLAYTMPLPTARGWRQEIEFGVEPRFSVKTNRFGGHLFDGHYISGMPLSAGWRGWRPDERGVWNLSANVQVGNSLPWGHILPWERRYKDYVQNVYDWAREGAKPNWVALRASVARDWTLPAGFGLRQRVWGQWTPDRLTDPWQFNLGGMHSVRGYREGEVSGDSGVGASMELLSPPLIRFPMPPGSDETEDAVDDAWRMLRPLGLRAAAFMDAGWMHRTGPRPVFEDRWTKMAGAGFGLRLDYRPNVSVRLDYAWRLRNTGIAADDRARGFGYLSTQVSF